MHTVTKVLVVFAAVLCVLLAALTMAYSVNAERIVGDYRAQVNARQAAEQTAQTDVSRARAEQQALNDRIAALQTQNTALSTQLNALQSELAQSRLDLNQAKLAGDATKAQIDQLSATAKTQATLIGTYRDEVTKLRENELGYRKREIELVDRLNDLESQREVQDGSIRALQEQLAEMRRNAEAIGTGVSSTGATGAGAPFKPSIPISGKIARVSPKGGPNGKPLVTINVGTNNQVRENMELAISRGGQFLANLVVTKADLQWAVGEVNTLGRNVEIREGDSVGTLVSR